MVSLRVGGLVRLLLVWFFPQGKPVSTSLTAVSQQGAYFSFFLIPAGLHLYSLEFQSVKLADKRIRRFICIFEYIKINSN